MGLQKPEFDMDEDRTYLNTIVHIRDGFERNETMSESMSKSMSESMSKSMSELERTKNKVYFRE